MSDGKVIVSAGKPSAGKGRGPKKPAAPPEDPPQEDASGDPGEAE